MASGSALAVHERSVDAQCPRDFYLLSVTGPPMPAEIKSVSMEKTVTAKPEVIAWLTRSLEAAKNAHAAIKPGDLQRHVKVSGRDATVHGMYLPISIHDNEHNGSVGRICPDEPDCAAVVRG